jgi:hypothetical protein
MLLFKFPIHFPFIASIALAASDVLEYLTYVTPATTQMYKRTQEDQKFLIFHANKCFPNTLIHTGVLEVHVKYI